MECSSNILKTLSRDYWNLPKDQRLLSLNHTLLTQKQLFHQERFKKSFPLKCSPGCPKHCNAEGTSANISGILHACWEYLLLQKLLTLTGS